ncbi:N-formylglutamate amidohydrolase [Urechidicola croceus]|uniref:N-formylglutamate amidohydrolase n=1 Tax=Urechidicola croceus TaxID=1850246 RepID=A0A1D8P4D8_9FLAO|nr:N-formylglutamate amidohydrolase [Urechidicola croceus]AOW19463.1 hypothetical protein LPB138_01630 [Urechidicola croceus]
MLRLSIDEIIEKIQLEEIFEAVSDDYSFTLKIDKYVHFICGAVHDGHQFRKSLWNNCLHSEYDRWFEEDPATKEMVQSFPIVIAGCDSRFEYDLNRAPETAIYTDAWGKQLWKNPLPDSERKYSLEKHTNFYRVVDALVRKIEEIFTVAVVYDMHSYNWKRWNREVPTFNLGTGNIDNNRFGDDAESWRKSLSEIKLPHNIKSTSLINDTFQGNGYFLKFITSKFKNTLVLATEVKKVYCDEYMQIMYPEVVRSIEEQLKVLLLLHATKFYSKHRKDL